MLTINFSDKTKKIKKEILNNGINTCYIRCDKCDENNPACHSGRLNKQVMDFLNKSLRTMESL